ncbi:ClpP/crotonase-like domain-containing protein [Pelagophyceae sp. CCMP2097]|nr:ClpP/crotonase-like domain-containing protein [Pelagophyceae sp. CCMP2097]
MALLWLLLGALLRADALQTGSAPRARLRRPGGGGAQLRRSAADDEAAAAAAVDAARPSWLPRFSASSFFGGTLAGVFLSVSALAVLIGPADYEGGESRVVRESAAQFEAVLDALDKGYVDVVDPKALFETAVSTMLATLDPYTEFEPTKEAVDMQETVEGKYGGVGLVISKDLKGKVVIVDAFEGYAWEAGIRPSDILEKVGGTKLTKESTLDQVRGLLRGEPGSVVEVEFTHSWDRNVVKQVVLRRDVVLKRDVELATFVGRPEDRVAFVRLGGFSRVAAAELRASLRILQRAAAQGETGGLRGIVLDLRGNPGGLLDAAVEVAGLFTPPGSVLVSVGGRGFDLNRGAAPGDAPGQVFTSDDGEFAGVPLAVLVDGATASASEIVAAAVQDLDAGVVVGSRTYGKGLVQDLTALPFDASLKVTVGRYFTPSGRCLQALRYDRVLSKAGRTERATESTGAFKTRTGRIVTDGGGVSPDLAREPDVLSRSEALLLTRGVFEKYADSYVAAHGDASSQLYESLLVARGVHGESTSQLFASATSKNLLSSADVAQFETAALAAADAGDLDVGGDADAATNGAASKDAAAPKDAAATKKQVRDKLRDDVQHDLKMNPDRVRRLAEYAVRERFFPSSANLKATLGDDSIVTAATELLNDRKRYDALLEPPR